MSEKEVEFAKKKIGNLSEKPKRKNKIIYSGLSQMPCRCHLLVSFK